MMNNNTTALRKGRKLRVSHVLIILLLIGAVAFAYFRLSLRWKLQARIDAIRAAGYPVTCAELNQWYKIPEDAENAAYTIIDAFSYYQQWNSEELKSLPLIGRAELPARTEPLAEETKALIGQYIADNNEALELLHAAAAIEHCRYPIDFSAGFATMVPDLANIRRGAMLLNLDAVLHAESGEAALATRSVISGFGLARSLAKEPLIVSQLVCAACQGLAVSSLEHIINRTEFTDEQLVEIAECIYKTERTSDISCGFVGERCMMSNFFMAPETVSPGLFDGVPPAPILELYKALGLSEMDAIIYLDVMDGYLKTIQLPLHRRQESAKAIEDKIRAISKIHILLHKLMPSFSRTITIDIKRIAGLRTARFALAVERYRLAFGELPDTLADLVPTYIEAVPKDPFDGDDLRYKKVKTGYVVYSIGEDKSDDGGKEQLPRNQRRGKRPNWDITFIIER